MIVSRIRERYKQRGHARCGDFSDCARARAANEQIGFAIRSRPQTPADDQNPQRPAALRSADVWRRQMHKSAAHWIARPLRARQRIWKSNERAARDFGK